VLCHARFDRTEELVEHVIACACRRHAPDVLPETVVRKLLRERKRSVRDALLDALKLQAGAAQVCLGRRTLQRWSIAHALEFEIELDAILAQGADASVYRLSTHF